MGSPSRRSWIGLAVVAALLGAPLGAEELEGSLKIGENLDVYLLPEPGFFQRLFGAVGLASPPEPVNLTETARHGRDEVVLALDEEGIGFDLYAKVRLSREGEPRWYRIGRSTSRYWRMPVQDGVEIMRVKKGALDVFEGAIEGDPWLLRVQAPESLQEPGRPKEPDLEFWLQELTFNYDELSHGGGSDGGEPDNYAVLLRALVTVLPDELSAYGGDPLDYERVKKLRTFVERAGVEELPALRDLLEAKVERLEDIAPADPEALEAAREQYGQLLAELRRRTADG